MKKLLLAGVALAVVVVSTDGQAQEHKPQKLTEGQMAMMKNMAMKNMDTYMAGGMEEMMKKLPPRMMGAQKEAMALGEKLFNSKTALSTNGQSCSGCHPGGGTIGGMVETPMPSEVTGKPYKLPVPSLVGAAATFPKYKIPNDKVITVGDMNNNCIMMFMAAQPPGAKSKEAKALITYVTSLSNKQAVEVGKAPPMMKGGM